MKTTKRNRFLYVLDCENGYKYIGESDNPGNRVSQHTSGHGARFTSEHPPLCVEQVMEMSNPFQEDALALWYMFLHGVNKVRGGQFSRLVLRDHELQYITHSLAHFRERCMRPGHLPETEQGRYDYLYVIDHGQDYKSVGVLENVEEEYAPSCLYSAANEVESRVQGSMKLDSIQYIRHPFEEDALVLELMSIHGIDRVRGGQFQNVELTDLQCQYISDSLSHASGECFHCHQKGHFIGSCPRIQQEMERKRKDQEMLSQSLMRWVMFVTRQMISFLSSGMHRVQWFLSRSKVHVVNENTRLCSRCGRNNHVVEQCGARTHYDGSRL